MQSSLLMKIEKALDDAGLSAREVTPFVKVRVVGLTSKGCARKPTKEGLITIWNPSEKQVRHVNNYVKSQILVFWAYDILNQDAVVCSLII